MSEQLNRLTALFQRNADLFVTVALFGILGLLIVPVPPWAMDVLLTMSIGLALLILLTVVYVREPSEFSVFPTILLAATLLRLGLNIASTRLILLEGYAGKVIESFGNFVVGGNYVVGGVIFAILVIINFIVITKGAGRIAEVSARFTLDAMPGKQMAIDADLNAGLIDEVAARDRREAIAKEADFYGSMDGASKFVRGDAVAGLLITAVNVVGGIAIGIFQRGLTVTDAMSRYTLLSIGDGLVSQVPALIISLAAGVLVTRSSGDNDLSEHVGRQLTTYPRALMMAGGMLGLMAFVPGLPFIPFAALGGGSFLLARQMMKKAGAEARESKLAALAGAGGGGATEALPGASGQGGAAAGSSDAGDKLVRALHTDILAVELGYGLLSLADPKGDGDLTVRIRELRQALAEELGMLIPPIVVRDNLELPSERYRILMRGKVIGESELLPNRFLAIGEEAQQAKLSGVPTTEPAFGLSALWINDGDRRDAEVSGLTVVDPKSILITHLAEVLKKNASLLLNREDVQQMIDVVKSRHPTLIQELIPDLASIGLIQRILGNLLAERIPLKPLNVILETLADFAPITKHPDELTEQIRRRLSIYYVEQFLNDEGELPVITLAPELEAALAGQVQKGPTEFALMVDPATTQHLVERLQGFERLIGQGEAAPVLLLSAELRGAFRRFFGAHLPRFACLSYVEVPADVRIQSIGSVPAPAARGASAA
ncbi:MAG: flagellar biosynthesis protein FlhA [Opitutales bacterium]